MSSLLRIVMSVLFYVFAVLRYVFYRAISSFLTVIVLLLVSILMFATFYQAYMPVVSHVKPVYLQFSTDCKDKMSTLCSYPEARVMFGSSNKANEQRMLMRGQAYKVFLDIEMPPSPINQKLGMFMVNIEFISADGVVLKTSSRSCMLPYESYLVKLFRTFFFSLPLTLGMTEEKQKIEMIFFDDYVDDSYKPAVQAKVVILTKQIEIYSSTLRLQASFTGLRYLIFNWPLVFSFFAIFANFITVTLLYSACVNQLAPSFYASNNSPRAEASTPQRDTELRNNRNGSSTIGRSLTPASLEMPQADANTVISNGVTELISDNLRENSSACSSSEHNEDVVSNLSHVQTMPLPRRNNRRPNVDARFEDVAIPGILRNFGIVHLHHTA
ncbi:seipin-like [Xenia sp. Carnegie-2017]|uniref:seipin-like n=1 Tax=Xenia sp. Carnegie-2017 TaxID=2897299 RepID=UPI001F049619|nr:seipin-like [Xenia sp. Carnegie-2017]